MQGYLVSKEMLQTEWEYIRKSHKSGLETKKLPASFNKEIRLGFDDDSCYHILCELDKSAKNKDTVEMAKGLKIGINEFETKGQQKKYFVISCSEENFEVFVIFADEFLKLIDLKGAEGAFYQTFKEWKKFWMGKRPPLSLEEQRGLFGEIYVLDKLHDLTEGTILEAWKGPLNGLHDFESDRMNLEIKTTTREPPVIRVSLIEQLTPLKSKNFFLIVVQMAGQDSGMSLVNLIENVRERISVDESNLKTYEDKLKRARYQKQHELYYGTKFSIRNVLFCPIDDDSPVLRSEIIGRVPGTVTRIGYDLNISGLEDRFTPTAKNWKDIGNMFS